MKLLRMAIALIGLLEWRLNNNVVKDTMDVPLKDDSPWSKSVQLQFLAVEDGHRLVRRIEPAPMAIYYIDDRLVTIALSNRNRAHQKMLQLQMVQDDSCNFLRIFHKLYIRNPE